MPEDKDKPTEQSSESSESNNPPEFQNPGQVSTRSSKPQSFRNPGQASMRLKVGAVLKGIGKKQK